ncbi:DUF1905 domain-containing protein [Dyella soli]|uniref:DUF1905 domain-containing protein n=1 Tax=Dyella soli TaxID=522319 RepID=A0A4R0YU47_9GAMM|nr:DUF1905 domain-containing protein [Dyella soli]TCI10358.1 DUF1905 domain-containing protein [Dyella soli]
MNRHRAVAFRATVQSGPKQWAVALPFDPVSQWSTPARPLWKCGHGHRVRGSLNGQTFQGAVIERAGAFWLLLEESLAAAAGVDVGQLVDVLIEPEDA